MEMLHCKTKVNSLLKKQPWEWKLVKECKEIFFWNSIFVKQFTPFAFEVALTLFNTAILARVVDILQSMQLSSNLT